MLSETRENVESVRKLIRDLQEIEEVVDSTPDIVQDAERLVGRVERLEGQVRRLADERVEVAGVVAFATLGLERYFSGDDFGAAGFLFLSGLFTVAFLDTLVKKKRDLGHFF